MSRTSSSDLPVRRSLFDDGQRPCVESLVRLISTDPFSLPQAQKIELLTAWERHSGWLESLKADAVVALAGPAPDFEAAEMADRESGEIYGQTEELYAVEDTVVDELAACLHVSAGTARRRIGVARDLAFKLPNHACHVAGRCV